MTSSIEEKEISTVLQSFPSLQLDEDKRREIASHIRREKELLVQMERRKKYVKVIGGVAASFALLFIAYQWMPSEVTPSVPSAQQMNTGESQKAQAAETTSQADMVLTLDSQIQEYVEEAIHKTGKAYQPQNMTVIVTNPNTGEILGMGNLKGPNDRVPHIVRAIPDPVAAFPIVTLAAAIEEGKYKDNETYGSGTYEITPGKFIKDHNGGYGWGQITYSEGIQRSSQVAFAKLTEQIPEDLLQKYFERFGFGAKTGTEQINEQPGKIPNMNTPYDKAMAAYGLAGSASAVQQVAAVGAVANGGELMKPHMTKEERNHVDKGRRVISEETAKQVREVLEALVNNKPGSDIAFSIKEYAVAGRTGIAEKRDHQGKIIEGKYTYSFIGFAPSDDPKLLVYIAVDDPQTDLWVKLWGQEIVAPPFKEIMENSLQYLQQR
ncbi:peptidoglycan D,D-transpeptidase FtsI family protein [Brevibacillus porteri]|uniref:Cell division protein FtsK n=1 Tax=Brevibacillus porteri TaxID=2126350 RepID=A0ABX5FIH8_9BACL|nr:penicillin-binding transpeptidase domain-containing protein [Brevibacillus porteri]MED1801970.1 penicillin-binding transpeptidase domain-containing protein [Brevibacillus porteri]MED2132531.1 penicillin-binding transpeptidase domain-containing protein [Brevibacillus porteri]MED2745410.1 penicillin-binding transpeptidase domain-containing protein [Brevibacillus porteri]MED2814313.1 penicillin-binding transpeptidase domain-containing protein [Brevibacillus porteri]MED2892561.1 penicillin-bind